MFFSMTKNIIKDLKSPQLVQKATFHSLLGLIHTLLKLQWTSSLVKYLTLQSYKTSSEIKESRLYILDYYCVESSVILYQIEGAIFLLDEENQCNHKVLRRPYLHSTEIFSNEYIKL